jgi:hypothetical protein
MINKHVVIGIYQISLQKLRFLAWHRAFEPATAVVPVGVERTAARSETALRQIRRTGAKYQLAWQHATGPMDAER